MLEKLALRTGSKKTTMSVHIISSPCILSAQLNWKLQSCTISTIRTIDLLPHCVWLYKSWLSYVLTMHLLLHNKSIKRLLYTKCLKAYDKKEKISLLFSIVLICCLLEEVQIATSLQFLSKERGSPSPLCALLVICSKQKFDRGNTCITQKTWVPWSHT